MSSARTAWTYLPDSKTDPVGSGSEDRETDPASSDTNVPDHKVGSGSEDRNTDPTGSDTNVPDHKVGSGSEDTETDPSSSDTNVPDHKVGSGSEDTETDPASSDTNVPDHKDGSLSEGGDVPNTASASHSDESPPENTADSPDTNTAADAASGKTPEVSEILMIDGQTYKAEFPSDNDAKGKPHGVSTETILEELTEVEGEGPVEVGLLFEGDIMLSAEEAEEVLHAGRTRRRRKVAYSRSKRWTLPIPYMFDQTQQYRLSE